MTITDGQEREVNNMANNTEITFELMEHIGVLSTNENGWAKEANIVAWNGGSPKVDIRESNSEHDRMTRGVTLTVAEASKLGILLTERYIKEDA